MRLKKLSEYHKEIKTFINSPHELAEINTHAAAEYSWYCEQMIKIKLQKAQEWEELKNCGDKPLSDETTEMKWRKTEAGILEVKIKYAMKALEKLMTAIKSQLINLHKEEEMTRYEQ